MVDIFRRRKVELDSPCTNAEVADISSTDHEFTQPTRMIMFTSAGTEQIRLIDSDVDIMVTLAAGDTLPWRVTHVRSVSTAGIIGAW